MKNIYKYYTSLVLAIISFNCLAAVTVVECVDSDGNKSFYKTCPAGTTIVNEKKIATGSKAAAENEQVTYKSTANVTATMYSIPDCNPCDAVRELLSIKQIGLTEKNIDGNIDLQTELKELNGSINVPITLIGDKKLSGYNRTEIISALKAAGWEDPNADKSKSKEKAKEDK